MSAAAGFTGPYPFNHQGATTLPQLEPITGDPTVSPGFARPIGWRVAHADGLAAWDKFGPNATDWVPVENATGAVASVNAQVGAVTLAANDPTLSLAAGAGTVTISQQIEAAWTLANVRWYAVDGTRPDDSGAGFSDASSAAAGLVAKKTFAGLSAIFPRVGAGRKVVIVIAAGTYVGGLDAFLSGVAGYATNFPLIVGTATNATASAVAFSGSVADRIYAGAVTVPGMNAGGYNPVAALSQTAIKCLQVGGGAPGFPAEPAEPMGWRVRFDSATTTAALRNVCAPIIGIPAADTLTLPNPATGAGGLPAVPAGTDVFYLEKAGVNVDATLLNTPSQPTISIAQNGFPQIVGVNFAGSSKIQTNPWKLSFCSASLSMFAQVELPFSYVDETGTARIVGSGLRNVGSLIGNWPIGPNFITSTDTPVITTGQVSLNTSLRANWGDGSYAGAGMVLFGIRNETTANPDGVASAQPSGMIGGRTANAQSPCRIVGTALAGSRTGGLNLLSSTTAIGRLGITGVGANPAIILQGNCFLTATSALTGSAGNLDVGLDLTTSRGSTIVIPSAPTVTGTAGDVRLADGTIVTWASLIALPLTDVAGNRFISPGGNGFAAAVANGAVVVALGAFGPAGSSATPVQWVKIPNPVGGFFTVPSFT